MKTVIKARLWIRKPDAIKPGSKMPAMGLSDGDVAAVASYLETLPMMVTNTVVLSCITPARPLTRA